MQILLDALLALLSCIGIWTLGRMALDWLLGCWDGPGMPVEEHCTKEAEAWTKQGSTTRSQAP